jgi:hypothetical protein
VKKDVLAQFDPGQSPYGPFLDLVSRIGRVQLRLPHVYLHVVVDLERRVARRLMIAGLHLYVGVYEAMR